MLRLPAKLTLIVLPAVILACFALATIAASTDSDAVVSSIVSDDFRIDVDTNRNAYRNAEILHLAVKLLNNSPYPVSLGICPVEDETTTDNTMSADEVERATLDDTPVDAVITDSKAIVIGYATLTRLGLSPVADSALEANDASEVLPIKFRLPLFGRATVPGHSTRIISLANILIKGPLVEAVAEPNDAVDVIPVVGKYIPLKPGYYLLDCRIEKLCGVKPAQAQKIIRILPRIIKPWPRPVPLPKNTTTSQTRTNAVSKTTR